ncbi:hypothetical protein [Mesonia sp. HuA40]|uniref:hypothetical protein n=1 Tax=Mesonia sp. HuA40 TaxID=2602761 RepID=UPI0011CB79F5|nr:hypothetical protein [Mesonia sp. HuA40]TXK74760.1 hypothetical protein FT993_01505 [Mesonia sp. HuA40]
MKLITRFAYYSVGLFFGIIILIFFFSGKRTSCDYSPNDRVLKNIRQKNLVYKAETIEQLRAAQIDTADMRKVFQIGNVDFGASNTSLDSCKLYVIEAEIEHKELRIKVENCTHEARIIETEIK